jgi:hypothetical protein
VCKNLIGMVQNSRSWGLTLASRGSRHALSRLSTQGGIAKEGFIGYKFIQGHFFCKFLFYFFCLQYNCFNGCLCGVSDKAGSVGGKEVSDLFICLSVYLTDGGKEVSDLFICLSHYLIMCLSVYVSDGGKEVSDLFICISHYLTMCLSLYLTDGEKEVRPVPGWAEHLLSTPASGFVILS